MSDVTRLLQAIERGDSQAKEELLPLVYEELLLRCLIIRQGFGTLRSWQAGMVV
jgi:ECF sigma factor